MLANAPSAVAHTPSGMADTPSGMANTPFGMANTPFAVAVLSAALARYLCCQASGKRNKFSKMNGERLGRVGELLW
jgi:hypothetical protein